MKILYRTQCVLIAFLCVFSGLAAQTGQSHWNLELGLEGMATRMHGQVRTYVQDYVADYNSQQSIEHIRFAAIPSPGLAIAAGVRGTVGKHLQVRAGLGMTYLSMHERANWHFSQGAPIDAAVSDYGIETQTQFLFLSLPLEVSYRTASGRHAIGVNLAPRLLVGGQDHYWLYRVYFGGRVAQEYEGIYPLSTSTEELTASYGQVAPLHLSSGLRYELGFSLGGRHAAVTIGADYSITPLLPSMNNVATTYGWVPFSAAQRQLNSSYMTANVGLRCDIAKLHKAQL